MEGTMVEIKKCSRCAQELSTAAFYVDRQKSDGLSSCCRECRRPNGAKRKQTHGHTVGRGHSPEHSAWSAMKARCHRPGAPNYYRYGGRGIAVCERWALSFEAFLSDMGTKPSGMTIERIDNDRGYEPGNCRWATRSEQMLNTSANHVIEFEGRAMPLVLWAKEIGLHRYTLYDRLRRGWSVERALSEPLQSAFRRTRKSAT